MPFIMIRPQYDTTLYIDDYSKTKVAELKYALETLGEMTVGNKEHLIDLLKNHEVDKSLDVEMCICRRCGFKARKAMKFDGEPKDFPAHEQVLRNCADGCERPGGE